MHETNVKIQRNGQVRFTNRFYQAVDPELSAVRERISSDLTGVDAQIEDLCRLVGRYQGKLLRPVMLLLSGKACGPLTPSHIDFAAVVEMVHLATLVHDDVLDEAEMRRKSPTVGRLWGNEASVLLGDLLLSRAFGLCSRVGDIEANRTLSETADRVCQGELLQCLNRNCWDMAEEKYLQIIEMKTASMYEVCCRLGSRFAGGSPEEISALANFGRLIGISFQIVDDLLDIVGYEDQAGKTLGTDLAKGKPTLPLLHFCRVSNREARQSLPDLAGQSGDALRTLLERTGSLEYSWHRAEDMAAQARKHLTVLKATSAREGLEELAEFVVKRTW